MRILPRKDKLIKPDSKGKYPILMRMAIEICPDELSMEWVDKGVSPANMEQAREFIRKNVPKHTMSRVVLISKQVIELFYAEPGYIT